MTKRLLFLLIAVTGLIGPRLASAQFDTPSRAFHNATAFRLDGQHQSVACESCHVNGQYKGTPNTCYDCHWVRRKDDRYQTRLGTQCEQCHRPTSWTAVRWNHSGQAGVALNADHRQIACESCHRNATFRASSVTCVQCHQKDFVATKSPNHQAAGFPANCDSCHKPSDSTWRNTGTGAFSHNAVYPLVGTHATVSCQVCHKNNLYKGRPRDCVGCHQADYNKTQSPNHLAAGFPLSCDACHRATDPAFKGSGAATSFNHNSVFALVGQHGTLECVTCHKNSVFKGTPRDCVGCHQADYAATRNPNHLTAGFGTTCETCHRPTDPQWAGANFNHNATFALVGLHATTACATCHVNGIFKGTPRTCVGCHQAKYNATRSPNHASTGFNTTCDTCHRETDLQWTGASFNHNSTFALVGKHAATACATCHVNNLYKGTPRTCVGCHLANYNATRTPNHASTGFNTTCETCHRATDSAWTQGTFTHTRFPITGPHNVACAQCHTTPNNYQVFSCTVCHTRSETDGHHRGKSGYVYDSNACYSCHPNGRAD